jgi:hypothetical protein
MRIRVIAAAIGLLSIASACTSPTDRGRGATTTTAPSATTVDPTTTLLAADPRPFVWMHNFCGLCTAAPSDLPWVVVYPDGTFAVTDTSGGPRADLGLRVLTGRLPADRLHTLAAAVAAVPAASWRVGPALVPVDAATMTDASTMRISVRVGSSTFRQDVIDLGDVAPSSEAGDRHLYLAVFDDLRSLTDGAATATTHWVALATGPVAPHNVPGAVWSLAGPDSWCALLDDPSLRTQPGDAFGVWTRPAGVDLLRPALPHETSCAAVMAWRSLVGA